VRTSAEYQIEYNWLTPRQFAERVGLTDKHGKPSAEAVRRIIAAGTSEVLQPPRVKDVSRNRVARYRIHPDAVEMYEAESVERVRERLAS